MTKSPIKLKDKGGDRRYCIAVPTEIFDLCPDVFEVGLLSVVAMIYDEYGACLLPLEDLATLAMMSVSKTSQCLTSLTQRGLLIAVPASPPEALLPGRHDGCSRCKEPYPLLEKHHIVLLSEGGLDVPENIAYICPNCHRLAHSLKYIPYWRAP